MSKIVMGGHEGVGRSLDNENASRLRRRIVEAVWCLWETGGHATISARALAREANLSVQTLYRHFPSMDSIVVQAQDDALDEAAVWCASQLSLLSQPQVAGKVPLRDRSDVGTLGLGTLMAALIDEWTQGRRRLAFAWREGLLLAARDQRFKSYGPRWRALWDDFWRAVCALCGISQYGAWTSFVFEGEASLHMLLWRRPIDRACLEELCHGWAGWLDGRLVAEGGWRHHARQFVHKIIPEHSFHDAGNDRLAAAAADIIEHQGLAKLTHRRLAEIAGVSLGKVSSRFRTSLDLVRGAFETIYQRLATAEVKAQEVGVLMLGLAEQLMPEHTLSIEELLLAVARDAEFQPFAPHLRYTRGRTSGRLLQMMLGPGTAISPLDAALFSDFVSGMQRAASGLSLSEKAQQGRVHLAELCSLLAPQPEA